jgi:hypothetical protein
MPWASGQHLHRLVVATSVEQVAGSGGNGLKRGSILTVRNPVGRAAAFEFPERCTCPVHSDLAEPQLNATPLIDVLLVLLVMLIFTLPLARRRHAEFATRRTGTPPAREPRDLFGGEIYWNGEHVDSIEQLHAEMLAVRARRHAGQGSAESARPTNAWRRCWPRHSASHVEKLTILRWRISRSPRPRTSSPRRSSRTAARRSRTRARTSWRRRSAGRASRFVHNGSQCEPVLAPMQVDEAGT